jgi:hypothetical protein
VIVLVLLCARPSCGHEQAIGEVTTAGIVTRPWDEAIGFAKQTGWRFLADGRIYCPRCAREH